MDQPTLPPPLPGVFRPGLTSAMIFDRVLSGEIEVRGRVATGAEAYVIASSTADLQAVRREPGGTA